MMNINRVLVPVDFSQEACFALEWAIQLLRCKSNSSIFLYHVFSPPLPFPPVPVHWGIDGLTPSSEKEAGNLESWIEKIPSHIYSEYLRGHGSVEAETRHFCQKYYIDLVITVARDHSGLSRWIRHNVCANVVKGATCPVLVLHHNRFQQVPIEVAKQEPAAMLVPQL